MSATGRPSNRGRSENLHEPSGWAPIWWGFLALVAFVFMAWRLLNLEALDHQAHGMIAGFVFVGALVMARTSARAGD